MRNFRDLGGNKTIDGRTVKKGLFFRSGHLANLSEEDIQLLKELNIKNIFDYRNDDEAMDNVSTAIESINNIRIPAMKMPSTKSAKFGSVEKMMEEMFDNDGAFYKLKNSYYNLPINNTSYKRLIELVKDENELPLLNHCTAGKDRTGVGCAIILMILGVSKEDIIKEYLMSNDYTEKSIEEVTKKRPELQGVPREKLNYVFGVNEDYINEAFKRIEEEYSSIEEYLSKEFDLNEEDIINIRNKYLE